jgi:hypothetical protein
MLMAPYQIGTQPDILSIVPGLGNLTVVYTQSTNYNPPPYYWYNVSGNVFGNSAYSGSGNTNILIDGLTSNISCNVGLRGVSSVGNTGNSYMSMVPYLIGTTPTIISIMPGPGLGNLTVNYKRSENYNPPPYYYYSVSGEPFGNSTYFGAGNTSIIVPRTSNISCNILNDLNCINLNFKSISIHANFLSSFQAFHLDL